MTFKRQKLKVKVRDATFIYDVNFILSCPSNLSPVCWRLVPAPLWSITAPFHAPMPQGEEAETKMVALESLQITGDKNKKGHKSRDVRGGEFSLGAGRGGARKKNIREG